MEILCPDIGVDFGGQPGRAHIGGDLAPSCGDGKIFRGPKFLNDLLRKKFPFSRPKFLMTFFSHRPYFSDFRSL